MLARPHLSLTAKRHRVVRHVHVHRHTHTVTFRPPVPPAVIDTFTPATAPLSAVSTPTTTGLPAPAPAPDLPPLGPKPQGLGPVCSWQAQRFGRFLRQSVWPVALTALDFVLRRTTVGFLIRPFNGP